MELGTLYTGLTAAYFLQGTKRQLDRSVWDGLGMIFAPSRVRLDDNSFHINNVLHPLEGIVFYGIPRANGADARDSFLTMAAASTFWEQVVELQEVASLNDHIVTLVSGAVLGEALFQNRVHLEQGSPTRLRRSLGWLFGYPVSATEIVRPRVRGAGMDGGSHGEPEATMWFYTGWRGRDAFRGLGPGIDVGFSTEVFRGIEREGAADEGTRTAYTELDVEASIVGGGVTQLRTYGRLVPVAWSGRTTIPGTASPLSLTIGPSAAFDAQMLGRTSLNEQVFAASLLGATADARLDVLGVAARFQWDLHGNFTSTSAVGWPSSESRQAETSVYRKRGYYYGSGLSNRGSLTLVAGPLEVEVTGKRHLVRSINALDRAPDWVRDPRSKRDRWAAAAVGVSWQLSPALRVSADREWQAWLGVAGDYRETLRSTVWRFRLGASL